MKPVNIIIVNDFAHITGGADYVALTSVIGLEREGYNVTLFSAVNPIMPELKNKGVKIVSTNQFDILKNPNRLRSAAQGIWNRKAAKEMEILLQKFDKKNTIIHVHSWTKALSSSVIRKALDKDFKVVITLHDYFTCCPNGGFYNYQQNQICEYKSLSFKCIKCNCDSRSYKHKVWRIIRQEVQKHFGFVPNKIRNYIYITDFSKKIIESYLPESAKLYYVRNPINSVKNIPISVENNKYFASVGRLNKEKGLNIFALAAKIVNCDMLCIGDGEEKNRILEINPKARITGWVNEDEVKDWLSNARALIFPSLLYETLGLPVLEAASMGIPSIVSDTCASREEVIDGVTGLWFKRNDSDDLAKKIKILKDDATVKKMGIAAYYKFWDNSNTVDSYIKELEKVYFKILQDD